MGVVHEGPIWPMDYIEYSILALGNEAPLFIYISE